MLQTGAQVADKAVQGILQRVDALAAKLGLAASQLWQIYLAQGRVEAIKSLIAAGLWLIGALVFGLLSWYCAKQESKLSVRESEGGWSICCILGGAVALLCIVFVGWNISDAVSFYLNPAYWAFQHLSADLKNLM